MSPAVHTLLGRLPAAKSSAVLVEPNQSVLDIIRVMVHYHKKNVSAYDAISPGFWKGNVYDTCKGLFSFCKKNIAYSEQPEEVQTVRTPQRILAIGSGDCKHYASFIGGVLDSLKRQGFPIEWQYRFASYKMWNSVPGHVFVVVDDGDGGEIWIDPVLPSFNDHKPYCYAESRRVYTSSIGSYAGKIGSVGSRALGGSAGVTVASVGGAIMVMAPALAVVVPVGTVIAAAAEVIGGIMKLVGGLIKTYSTSSQVRWLTQLYQYYVLGQGSVTGSQEVNEGYTLAAQSWFSVALGVPIYDRLRFNAIKGAYASGVTKAQAVAAYLSYPETSGGKVPQAAAEHAYDIAQALGFGEPPGAWANTPPANVILTQPQSTGINIPQTTSAMTEGILNSPSIPGVNMPSTLPSPILPAGSSNMLIWLLAGGAVILFMSGHKKRA